MKVYNKQQIDALKGIPINDVRQKFNIENKQLDRKVRTAVDVLIYEAEIPYKQALQALDEAFPKILTGEDLITAVPIKTYNQRLENITLPATLRYAAREAMKQIDAFGCSHFHIYAKGESVGYSSRNNYPDGMELVDLIAQLPMLARINTAQNGAIYFAPIHADNRISIPVDDVKDELIQMHRPTLIFATSDRSKQAHYVIERKYPIDFYDYITQEINKKYGDPKILRVGHDTRLAGFTNRKKEKIDGSGGYPYAKIIEYTHMRCKSFEKFIDEEYKNWSKNMLTSQTEDIEIEDIVPQLKKQEKVVEQVVQDKQLIKSGYTIQHADIPEYLEQKGLAYQQNLVDEYGLNIDRSRADFMIACYLYKQGATQDEVYQWLMQHATQTPGLVTRYHTDGTKYEVDKQPTFEKRQRYCVMTAENAKVRVDKVKAGTNKCGFKSTTYKNVQKQKKIHDTLQPKL